MSIIVSFLASALFFMALCFAVLQVKRWGKYWPLAYVLVGVSLVIPLNDWMLIEFVRGYFSDFSIPSLFIIIAYIVNCVSPVPRIKITNSFNVFVLLIGLFVMPMSLGLSQFDPFAMGYPSNSLYLPFALVCLLIGIAAWWFKLAQIGYVIAVALILHGLNVYESSNLWTYLIDPIAIIICLFSLLVSGMKRVPYRFKKVES